MGGLTIITYLCNNPDLKIAGTIWSAPFLGLADPSKADDNKKMIVKLLAPHLDVSALVLIRHRNFW